MIFSNHQIHFPISKTGTLFHYFWTLFNALAIGDYAPAVVTSNTFSPFLLTAQMFPQVSTNTLVCINILVDMFVTDRMPFSLKRPEICSGLQS